MLCVDSLHNQQPTAPKFVGKTKVQSYKGENEQANNDAP